MDIVKELNLNRNPKSVSNGSIVCAKNIKLSADGSFITNDDGFKTAIVTANSVDELKISNVTLPETPIEDLSDYSIFGNINMPNETVLFCMHTHVGEQIQDTYIAPEILRLIEHKDNTGLVVIPIRSAWKYDIGDINGVGYYNSNNELIVAVAESSALNSIPLKIINLNTCSDSDDETSYTINPDVPISNLKYVGKEYGGSIPNGTYNFFIRYKIAENIYTKWFPIGRTYHATNAKETTIVSTGQVEYKNRKVETVIKFPVGNNDDCPYNPMFKISFDTYLFYKEFQIGYVLQHDGSLVGRIWKNFDISTSKFIFDGNYIEEEGVDNFTKSVFGLYNVKALTSFKNKLYLANYKETDYNDDGITNEIISSIEPYYKIIQSNINEKGEISSENKRYTFSCRNVSYVVENFTNNILTLYDVLKDPHILQLFFVTSMNTSLDFSYENLYIKDGNEYYHISYWRIENTSEGYILIRRYDDNGNPVTGSPRGTWTFGIKRNAASSYYNDKEYGNVPGRQVKITIETLTPEVYDIAQALSLDEGEVYSFYVHYVRRDGSYTNGYPVYLQDNNKSLTEAIETPRLHDSSPTDGFYRYYRYRTETLADKYICRTGYTDDSTTGSINVLYPVFKNIQIPENYIGVFFSYEKVEPRKIFSGVINYVGKYPNANPDFYYYKIHALGPELGLSNYKCDKIRYNNRFYDVSNSDIKISNSYDSYYFNSTLGKEGGIFITLENDLGITKADNYDKATTTINNVVGYSKNNNIYNKKSKELISLGHIITKIGNTPLIYDSTEYDCELPNYIQKEYKIIVNPKFSRFDTDTIPYRGIIINDTADYIEIYFTLNGEEGAKDYREIKSSDNTYKFDFPYYIACEFYNNSRYDFNAITYKEKPQNIKTTKEGICIVVKPDNLSDLFEYRNSFNFNPVKIYFEYNSERLHNTVVTNVIRRSYTYRSEGIDLPWRNFDSDDYKVVDYKNGPITNLVGIGNNLFIHTANTLCYVTSDAKLQANNTDISIANHDIYDLDPTDLFPSDLGYGGLKYVDCQSYSQYGYIWYDTEHYKLFRFDSNKLDDLTADIQEIISYYKFEKCFINIDTESNRIFFSFYNKQDYFTLAFSTITNKFISIMDFMFDMSIHTTNCIYFALKGNNDLYKYDKTIAPANYDALTNTFVIFGEAEVGKSYIDIIFNEAYEIIKNVESVNWIHQIINVNSDKFDTIYSLFVNTNRDEYNKDLKGMYIQIYSDRTRTDVLPLYREGTYPSGTDKNRIFNEITPDAYKYPWFNKGVWNFNYFRDILNTGDTVVSDTQSLIYGKFVIVRLIYNGETGKRLKLDNLNVNFNKY